MEFVWGAEGVDVGELNDLFEKVGAACKAAALRASLAGRFPYLCAG